MRTAQGALKDQKIWLQAHGADECTCNMVGYHQPVWTFLDMNRKSRNSEKPADED